MTNAWTYQIKTGKFFDPTGECIAVGYSGLGKYKNDETETTLHGEGPIPKGEYDIGPAHFSNHTGPITLDLTPRPDTLVFGRSAFRIHGDNINHPGTASHGCIILPRAIREKVDAVHGTTYLKVI